MEQVNEGDFEKYLMNDEFDEFDFKPSYGEWKCLIPSKQKPSSERYSSSKVVIPKLGLEKLINKRDEDDPTKKKKKRTSPPPLTSCTLVAFQGKRKLCLFGGMSEKGSTNSTWIFDLGVLKWKLIGFSQTNNEQSIDQTFYSIQKTIVPPKRCGHCAATIGSNEMYLFGGQYIEKMVYYNDLWVFRLGKNIYFLF